MHSQTHVKYTGAIWKYYITVLQDDLVSPSNILCVAAGIICHTDLIPLFLLRSTQIQSWSSRSWLCPSAASTARRAAAGQARWSSCRWGASMRSDLSPPPSPSPLLLFSDNHPCGCMFVRVWWHVVNLSLCPPQGHFSTCAFNVIPCPNRCSVKLTRRDLPDHLQHDCPKRKVKCEFCGSEFTGEAYEVNTYSKPVFISFLSFFFPLLQLSGSLT